MVTKRLMMKNIKRDDAKGEEMFLPDQIEPNCNQANTSSSIGADCGHSAKIFPDEQNPSESQGVPQENSLLTIRNQGKGYSQKPGSWTTILRTKGL